MEKNSGKFKILEFNGLPGTGKSTLIKNLKMDLEDYSYISNDEIYSTNFKKLLFFYLRPHNFKYLFLLFCILMKFPLKVFTNFVFFKRILFIYYYKKVEKSKIGLKLVLIDEGIIQYIISIWYDKKIRNSHMLRIFLNNSFNDDNDILINCIIDVNTAKERIKERNIVQGRLDRIKDDIELLRILSIQKENFELIRKLILTKKMELDTNKSIKENVNYLKETIKEW